MYYEVRGIAGPVEGVISIDSSGEIRQIKCIMFRCYCVQ